MGVFTTSKPTFARWFPPDGAESAPRRKTGFLKLTALGVGARAM